MVSLCGGIKRNDTRSPCSTNAAKLTPEKSLKHHVELPSSVHLVIPCLRFGCSTCTSDIGVGERRHYHRAVETGVGRLLDEKLLINSERVKQGLRQDFALTSFETNRLTAIQRERGWTSMESSRCPWTASRTSRPFLKTMGLIPSSRSPTDIIVSKVIRTTRRRHTLQQEIARTRTRLPPFS